MIVAFAVSPAVHLLIAYAIFLASYLVFAIGRFPGTKIDRPAAAVIGAALMFAFRVISPSDGIRSIDYATIVLLACMMLAEPRQQTQLHPAQNSHRGMLLFYWQLTPWSLMRRLEEAIVEIGKHKEHQRTSWVAEQKQTLRPVCARR